MRNPFDEILFDDMGDEEQFAWRSKQPRKQKRKKEQAGPVVVRKP